MTGPKVRQNPVDIPALGGSFCQTTFASGLVFDQGFHDLCHGNPLNFRKNLKTRPSFGLDPELHP